MEDKFMMTDIMGGPIIDVDLGVLDKNQVAADTIYERKVKPQLEDITRMKSLNMSDKEMCKILDISTSTFYALRKQHLELQTAYQIGIDILVDEVERSALKEAIGYEYEEDAIHPKMGVVSVRKYARGNASMQKYILSNKRPKQYQDKQIISNDKSTVIDLTALYGTSPLELKKLIDTLSRQHTD